LMGVDFQNIDIALGIGWVIGIASVGIVAWVANFLEKREGKDILEVATEVKAAVRGAPKPVAAKKRVAKK